MILEQGDLIERAENGDFDVIIQGCNCFHTMGAGIAKSIRINTHKLTLLIKEPKLLIEKNLVVIHLLMLFLPVGISSQ